jgi:hypothetical protein
MTNKPSPGTDSNISPIERSLWIFQFDVVTSLSCAGWPTVAEHKRAPGRALAHDLLKLTSIITVVFVAAYAHAPCCSMIGWGEGVNVGVPTACSGVHKTRSNPSTLRAVLHADTRPRRILPGCCETL